MFDPTAFENMRVVLEGIFYDKDLEGEITIKDRNDYINTAKLSRKYDLTFQLLTSSPPLVSCRVALQANLENLAAELLSSKQSDPKTGSILSIEYYFQEAFNENLFKKIKNKLEQIWGLDRSIHIFSLDEPLKCNNNVTYKINISFDRIISEDQMEDFSEMTQYILTTLETLENVIKNK